MATVLFDERTLSTVAGTIPAPFPFLDKVHSVVKRAEITDILFAPHPTHEERLWLAGFLKYAGYTVEEVCKIIDQHCEWQDYNPSITAYQVASVFRAPHRDRTRISSPVRRKRKWQLTAMETLRIKVARSAAANRKIDRYLKEHGITTYTAPHTEDLPFRPELLQQAKRAPRFC
jgi:hypothetical protein